MSLINPLTNHSIPDSEICNKATQLVAEVSPGFLCHHCIRTFLFGDLLGQRDGLKCDRELLYLGAVMHDLGLSDRFEGEQRFEVDGADAARAFALKHGLSTRKRKWFGTQLRFTPLRVLPPENSQKLRWYIWGQVQMFWESGLLTLLQKP